MGGMGTRRKLMDDDINPFYAVPIIENTDPEVVKQCIVPQKLNFPVVFAKMDLATLQKLKQVLYINKNIPTSISVQHTSFFKYQNNLQVIQNNPKNGHMDFFFALTWRSSKTSRI